MHNQVASWFSSVSAVNSLVALKSAIDSAAHQLGFRYFIYRGHFPGVPDADRLHIDTAPAAWHDYRRAARIEANWDPLHVRALRTVTPILWCNVRSSYPAHFEKAREFGLATGVTQPIHGPHGDWSSISFIKDRAGLRADRDVLGVVPQCQLLTSLAHDAVQRIVMRGLGDYTGSSDAHPESTLSDREAQCLALAAFGKTIQQIAVVLPITERTVAFHLTNARRKLGTGSLRHAITKAASLGLIQAA